MHELDFVNGKSLTPEATVNAYINMYRDNLLEQTLQALRAAACLGNKKLAKTLAVIAQCLMRRTWRSPKDLETVSDDVLISL
jgi:uncharacterized Ntn-hydrolase superfamily protein